MNKQFGIPLGGVPKRTVKGYEERVPAVLEMLKNYLMLHGGLDIVGIFRLAPDKDDCNWAKQQINEGEFEAVDDVNIVANLIKVFFRELPVSLLEQFRDEDICKIAEMPVGQSVLDAVEQGEGGSTIQKSSTHSPTHSLARTHTLHQQFAATTSQSFLSSTGFLTS